MFDKYFQCMESGAPFPNTPQNVEVTVTEKRAATDDSVRLLKEMQEKALGSLIDRTTVQNVLNGEVFTTNMGLHHRTTFAFVLNGNDYIAHTAESPRDFHSKDKMQRIRALFNGAGAAIAEVLLEKAIKEGKIS